MSLQRGLSARPLRLHLAQRCVGPFVSRGRHRSSDGRIRSGEVSRASTTPSVDWGVFTRSAEVKAAPVTDRVFRPDVQGLRALAVMLVVLYHIGVPGLRGGFVGVDVFFVISGYVITALLLRELHKNDSTSLRGFYARRARRILPAATLVIVGTTVASFYFLGFIAGNQEASDASAASLFVSNFHFIQLGTDYASAHAPPSPLQNFWSLAVEEQFYLIYPAVFILTAKCIRRVGFETKLGIVLSTITVSSFGWSAIETISNPAAAYFSPLTESWLCRFEPRPLRAALLDGAAIAQLVEHVIRNDGVGSSNLSCGTNDFSNLLYTIKALTWANCAFVATMSPRGRK